MVIEKIKQTDVFKDENFLFSIDKGFLNEDYKMHSHQFKELFIITKGSSLHKTNSVVQTISAGDVFMINCNEVTHGFIEPSELELYNIIYTDELLRSFELGLIKLEGYQNLFVLSPFFNNKQGYRNTFRLSPKALNRLRPLLDKLHAEYMSKIPGYKTITRALFMELIVELCRGQQKEGMSKEAYKVSKLGEAVAEIESNFTEPIMVKELAMIASMSERQFLRIFRECFGCSPKTYIINLRMKKAMNMLVFNENIAEVAYSCGFSDPNYFTRKFREIYGCVPTAYIKDVASLMR